MITLKQCKIRNWDNSRISPLLQIRDKCSLDLVYLNLIKESIENRRINKRFHDEVHIVANKLLRWCHGAMGMYAGTKTGCLYSESDLSIGESLVEHTIPVSQLVRLHLDFGVRFPILLFMPVTRLSQASNDKLRYSSKFNANINFPFRRYHECGIVQGIVDHDSAPISSWDYSLHDHFKLIRKTADKSSRCFNADFAEIFNFYNMEGEIESFYRVCEENRLFEATWK